METKILKYIFVSLLLIIISMFVIYSLTNSKRNQCNQQNKKSNKSKIKLINYNASWCGWSIRLQPVWKQLNEHFKNNSNVEIIDFKCDLNEKNDDVCRQKQIKGFPEIVLEMESKSIPYVGDRSFKSFIDFINNNLN